MSLLSSSMSRALSALSRAAGQTVYYRQNSGDTWHELTGAFLQPSAPQLVGYDENHNAIMLPMTARLKVPYGATHLLPGSGGVSGSEVKDHEGTIWAVLGSDHTPAQSIYALGRAPVASKGGERGGVA